MKKNITYNGLRIWLAAAILSVLTACGGGGGGGGSSDNVASPAPSPSKSVSGSASKGPLDGATIRMYEINADGSIGTDTTVTTTTDANGNFTLDFTNHSADGLLHLLQASDGSYKDESDQEGVREIAISGVILEAILPDDASTIAITPYTNALYLKSLREAAEFSNFEEVYSRNQDRADTAYGFDIVTTIPADPISPGSAGEDEKRYALLLGGAAVAMNNIAIHLGHPQTNAEIIQAFIEDLSDGAVDGYVNDSVVEADDSTLYPTPIPNINLTREIERFRNNNQAAYGTLLTDIDTDTLGVDGGGLVWDDGDWDEARWQ